MDQMTTCPGGVSWDMGLSELKAKKAPGTQEELLPVVHCPVGHG